MAGGYLGAKTGTNLGSAVSPRIEFPNGGGFGSGNIELGGGGAALRQGSSWIDNIPIPEVTGIGVPVPAVSGVSAVSAGVATDVAIAAEGSGSGGGTSDTTPTSPTKVEYGDHYRRVNGRKRLKPNVEYTDPNGYVYRTDAHGRIVSVEADLRIVDGTPRNRSAQSRVGRPDRLSTDDGGHLIGRQFGGSKNIDNLVPQSSSINRGGGEWWRMEQSWEAALRRGDSVTVNIQVRYNASSMRPIGFDVQYRVSGRSYSQFIEN